MTSRIAFFGSPPDAVPALEALVSAGHEIAAVYTRPDRPAGRSRQLRPTAVKVAAESLGLRVETPGGLRQESVQQQLRDLNADAFVVVAYGRILPAEVLSIPRLGTLNIHPSLLPRHRGPSPVATAILDGEPETGVTLMLLDEGMDSGPLLAQSEPVTLNGTERTSELTARLFGVGAQMLPETLSALGAGSLEPVPQDESKVTITSLIEKSDGEVDWQQSAARIERMTRAFDPWPGAFTSFKGRNLKLIEAGISSDVTRSAPGQASVRDRRLFVSTGDGELELTTVQPEGKKPMPARDFINGNPDIDGAVLGI